MYIGLVLSLVAMLVYPMGFKEAGEPCSSNMASDQPHVGCGLECDSGSFNYFHLCYAWQFGLHFILAGLGVVALLFAVAFFSCVRQPVRVLAAAPV